MDQNIYEVIKLDAIDWVNRKDFGLDEEINSLIEAYKNNPDNYYNPLLLGLIILEAKRKGMKINI